ncbi:MAG: dockerin type I domain-containing protein [Pirellulaceae bacterium]
MALGPQLIGVLPNAGSLLEEGNIRNVAPQELLFKFDENQVFADSPATLQKAFQITRSGGDGVFGDVLDGIGDDVIVTPGYVGLVTGTTNQIVLRFKERLADDHYRLIVKGTTADALRNTSGMALNDLTDDNVDNGSDFRLNFELDLGAQIVAVVPQPIHRNANGTLVQDRNQIVVYFNNDDLFVANDSTGKPTAASAENPAFYQLMFTRDTVSNQDDVTFLPTRVQYDAATDRAVLTFAQNLDDLAGPGQAGTFRLRIGTDESIPAVPVVLTPATDPGSSFSTAEDLSAVFNAPQAVSVKLSEAIVSGYFPLDFPGAVDEPGNRSIPVQGPYIPHHDVWAATFYDADFLAKDPLTGGITLAYYNFQDFYGFDPEGNTLHNQITESQKQRTREIFELYSEYLGIDFIETAALGMTIVTGDLRALDPTVNTQTVAGLAEGKNLAGRAIMNAGVNWSDRYGDTWFQVGMHEIGHLLGLYHTDELGPITIQNDEPILAFDNTLEPDFPGQYDITHGQHVFRPENKDIDLYRFQLQTSGLFTAETFAERLPTASLLDTSIKIYKQTSTGIEEIAQNDDYYSQDSFVALSLGAGVYYIGVSASGNEDYDPEIADSGIGGTSQGDYDLRLNFRPGATRSITDKDNPSLGATQLDGDLDGVAGGVNDFWFRAAAPKGIAAAGEPKTIYVDKSSSTGLGTLSSPYGNLASATANAVAGDIIRVVGNGGLDKDLETLGDNRAYEIGLGNLPNNILSDGAELVVPKLVTLMIDEGAIFKLKDSRIGVGSSTLSKDLSAGAIQVLGTPDQSVIFTSFQDENTGVDTDPLVTAPSPGDWGGIMIRDDLDRAERRFLWDEHGIFLNYVNHADIRYGGGNVKVDGVQQIVNPISLNEAAPTISFNKITKSSDAAISADPNSFMEWNYDSPRYQADALFTSDYTRVGPDIDFNTIVENTTNGLVIRVTTPAGTETKPQTVAARWNDTDIVHVLGQTLFIQGTSGGPVLEQELPTSELITLTRLASGKLAAGTYNYKLVWVDSSGNESLASVPTRSLTVPDDSQIRLQQLPPAPAGFVARRLYRSEADGLPTGEYRLVAQLNASSTTFTDVGNPGGNLLDQSGAAADLRRARLNASLVIDPNTIVKLDGARIEVGMGAQVLAEGRDGQRVIFTSKLDDKFGAGGTFDTGNDGTVNAPAAGDWGGIFVGPTGAASFDYSLFTYGGGVVPVEGSFTGFNVLEVHQADVRVTHSIFERNANGLGGQAPSHRFGRGFNETGTIFIRNAQPVIVENIIRDNLGAAINANVNALDPSLISDPGRSTGLVDVATDVLDNQGPLIKLNKLEGNSYNGMIVRGETLTTQSVWDDTDIVHVVMDTIYISDFHIYGGLRLESKPTESLVVKLQGANSGFTATGRPLDIDDRIGGIIQVIGQPGSPVVFTSLRDDTKGAGFRSSDGLPQTDTNNDGSATLPSPGDWRSILIDQYAHDRNVDVILEAEPADVESPGPNASTNQAELLGKLASSEKNGDENLRLGFEVHGFLNARNDIDVYSLQARAGTEIWIDFDRTRHSLDTVVELIGSDGQLIARSDDSYRESNRTESIVKTNANTDVNVLQKSPYLQGRDAYSTNPNDAGMRVVLPGTVGSELTSFYIRVRSSSANPTNLAAGQTMGRYQFQVRLRETDEVPGSTIRYADIRYATNGIEVYGQPIHSPLASEAAEANNAANNAIAGAQALGNILNTDRAALSIAGELTAASDVDFYRFEINYDSVQGAGIVNPYLYLSTIFDVDYSDQIGRSDASLAVFDANFRLVLSSSGVRGRDNSNIAEDQPKPLNGADMDDTSRGSAGTLDPFIGAQSLPQGTYYLAVTNSSRMPAELEQFVQSNPSNPLIRLEPIDSLARIAEERVNTSGGSNIPDSPKVDLLDTVSVVPFTLGDVTLFVSTEPGEQVNHVSKVQTVDPITGVLETTLGDLVDGSGRRPYIGDIAMRYDGQLFSFSRSYLNLGKSDALVGNYLQIDTGTAAVTSPGDDGIVTYSPNPTGPGSIPVNNGVYFSAITFAGNNQYDLFAVGDRGPLDSFANPRELPVTRETNILYEFDINTGVGNSMFSPTNDRPGCPPGECLHNGAGTQIRERGQIITTGSTITTVDATNALGPFDPAISIQDGAEFTVATETFEFDTGPEVTVDIDPTTGRVIRDGDFMILDGDFFQFDTGSTLIIPEDTVTYAAGATIPDGLLLTLVANTGALVRLEFEDTDVNDGRETSGSVLVNYDATTTQGQLQNRIVSVLNSITVFPVRAAAVGDNLVSFTNDARITLRGQFQIVTTNTILSTLNQPSAVSVAEDTILIPNGGYVDGETLTISDGNKSVLFEFDNTELSNGFTPGAVQISFDSTSVAADIFSELSLGILASDLRVSPQPIALQPSANVLGLHLETSLKLSGELGDAPIASVLDGSRFNDGETFTVVTTDGTVRFEVDLGDGVTAGNVQFSITSFDTSVMIAQQLAEYVNEYTSAEARAVYETVGDSVAYVLVNGQQLPLGRTVPGAHLLFQEASAALAVVPLFDYAPNPDNPTFNDIEGLLRGFEETMTQLQFQQRLASELNIRRAITGATNDPFAPIVITSDDHGLRSGQSVLIRDVTGNLVQIIPGQVFANGLFDVTVVDANTFALNGTQFRNFSDSTLFNYVDGGYFINYEANSRGDRTNFLGGLRGQFTGVPIFVDQGTLGGVSGGNVRVPLRAQDTANQVAVVMAQFINRELYPTVTAQAVANRVQLANARTTADAPLVAVNAGMGGSITGIAVVNNTMYAVDDRGGLYRIDGYRSSALTTEFIANVGGVEFAGLSTGPPQVENGVYSDVLFGISRTGRLYAFDTLGELQPIFVDGQTSIQTGATGNVTGVAFSNLDKNLWHVTGNRRDDAGHGIAVPVDNSRIQVNGGDSFYFGFQNPNANAWGTFDPTNRNNYNFPGGAHGSLETNTFNLQGYSPSDDPVLYFNYFLETEGATYNPNPLNPMRDAFRVFISADNGDWQLLATNDSARSDIWLDEYQLGEGAVPQEFQEVGRRGIQELYDNTNSWRQARIQLAPWAGMDNLKLRFDFSTAASMDVGATGGVDIRGIASNQIRDGETLVIDGAVVFEFDFGHILVAPSAQLIADGAQLDVYGTVFEFDKNNDGVSSGVPVPILSGDSAADVAQKVEQALLSQSIVVIRDGNRLNLPALGDVNVLDSGLIHEAVPGVSGANRPMNVTIAMTAEQVAAVVRKALEDRFAGGDFGAAGDGYQNVQMFREVVRLVGHTVTSSGPLGVNSALQGDSFGGFNASGPPAISGRFAGSLRGMDNNHEGVYIDDIIIGFAERGELVTGAVGNADFVANPQEPDFSELQGMYQVEVRRGPEYGLSDLVPPVTFNIYEFLGGRSFDTNDRLGQHVSFVAPSADQLRDGQQFQISDGVDTVVFEYEDLDINNGVTPGHLMIPFDSTAYDPSSDDYTPEPAYVIARRIRDAINGSQAQAVIDIVAALSDGEIATPANPPRPDTVTPLFAMPSTSNVIDLFGNATGDVFPTFDFGDIEVITYGYSDISGVEHEMVGDSNVFRDQGQILIHSNIVRDSLQFGIVADAGARDRGDLVPEAGILPHAGPVANLRVQNTDRLVPGVVIANNVIANSGTGGIHFSGDAATTGELGSVPFGRIINNTIHGNGSGVGIQVSENASPTILNTILSNVQTGVSIDATSTTTQMGGLLFKGVGTLSSTGQVGAYPIVLGASDPLFVDPANYNFLLAAGSIAIDSSIDSLDDRQNLFFVKDPLGISKSPILAPDRDVYGQLRGDDPSVNTPAGQGENVFKDRGAVDRVDFIGPFALLLNPRDNDADGNDANPRDTIVNTTVTLTDFRIQLVDTAAGGGEGTGADDTSVLPDTVTLLRDGLTLVRGVDYSFAYDSTSNTIRLSPIAGIWEKDRLYEIDLVNATRTAVNFLTSTPADEDAFTLVDTSTPTAKSVKFEYDTGYVILVPATGGAALTDGETFSIRQGSTTKNFEFDSNNNVAAGRTRVSFTATSSQEDIANAIALAIVSSGLTLTPKNVGQGRVHIGGNASTTLDTSTTALDQAGKPGTLDTTAIAIVIVPGRGDMVARATADAIMSAVAQGKLVGIKAEAFGSDLYLDGMASITGLTLTTRDAIQDLAANNLRPNRSDGTTRFTILTGLGTDYGDAPASYPVLRENNGAGHRIAAGFHLGATVDAEPDGQPSLLADADLTDDGVLLEPMISGKETTIIVSASAAGYLDAWLDANGDGDFDDAGEKIFNRTALVAGPNTLTLEVTATAVDVPTYMRFRFSSTGGLAPRGIAEDGEVEDYVVTIGPNPWQNSSEPRDVSGDGHISPLDALLIINVLNFPPEGISIDPLPPPGPDFPAPPYYDVNGDGSITPLDALIVINYLNNPGQGEGESEGDVLDYGVTATAGDDPLVDNGLATGLLGSPSSVTVGAGIGATEPVTAAQRVVPAVSAEPVSPATGYPEGGNSSAELLGNYSLTDLQAEDLDDLLTELAEETGDLAGVVDAYDAVFARLGA